MRLKLKLTSVLVLTVLTGVFLIFAGISQGSRPGHAKRNIHSAVYHRPTAHPTRIA